MTSTDVTVISRQERQTDMPSRLLLESETPPRNKDKLQKYLYLGQGLPSLESQICHSARHTSSATVSHEETIRERMRSETLVRTLASSKLNPPTPVRLPPLKLSDAEISRNRDASCNGTNHKQDICGSYAREGLAGSDASPSLSVFNAPTATYMWPKFNPAAQTSEAPVIYVRYKHAPRSPWSSLTPSPAPEDSGRDESRKDRAARKRRHSVDAPRVGDMSPLKEIIDPLKGIRVSDNQYKLPTVSSTGQRRNNGLNLRRTSPFSDSDRVYQARRDLMFDESEATTRAASSCGSRSGNDSDPEEDHTSETGGGVSSRHPTAEEQTKWSDKDWLFYARERTNNFLCVWPCTNSEGETVSCGYSSRKHLVKRHIETTHMKIKRWKCHICGKAFPQKGSLDNHIHTHTGAKPHGCHFGCGATFNDPARRHRHMIEKHGYVPKRPYKRIRQEHDSIRFYEH